MSAMSGQEPEQFAENGKVRLLRRRSKPRVSLRHRMPAEKLRRGVYLIPSLFTAGNLMCGFFSIIATFNGEFIDAALFIILANILDGIDGYACTAAVVHNGRRRTSCNSGRRALSRVKRDGR